MNLVLDPLGEHLAILLPARRSGSIRQHRIRPEH